MRWSPLCAKVTPVSDCPRRCHRSSSRLTFFLRLKYALRFFRLPARPVTVKRTLFLVRGISSARQGVGKIIFGFGTSGIFLGICGFISPEELPIVIPQGPSYLSRLFAWFRGMEMEWVYVFVVRHNSQIILTLTLRFQSVTSKENEDFFEHRFCLFQHFF